MKLVKAVLEFLFGTSTAAPTTPAVKTEEDVETQRNRLYSNLENGYRTNWDGFFSAIQYLIDAAETMEHIKKVLEYAGIGAWYTDRLDLEQLWKKWIEKATLAEEMEQMWAYREWLTHPQKNALIRRWYALATTFDQIANIPERNGDNVLNGLIKAKKVKLIEKALQSATTCSELISICTRAGDDFKPTTLSTYSGWDKDELLTIAEISHLYSQTASDIPLSAEAVEKWTKVSMRDMDNAKTGDVSDVLRNCHSSARRALTEKWDLMSAKEVASATTESEIVQALERARPESSARIAACEKLDAIRMVLVEEASTKEELWKLLELQTLSTDFPSVRLTVEKYVDLAETEQEMRKVWHWTENLPSTQQLLLHKLSALIK